jgi:glutathione peroxidase
VIPRRLALLLPVVAGVAVLVSACGGGPSPSEDAARRSAEAAAALQARQEAMTGFRDRRGTPLLRGTAERIDGTRQDLGAYRGRVVLVVNTASRCGYTGQFGGLETLYRASAPRGLTVLGFPSDDFRQELGDDAAIKRFCRLNYGVSFPMFARARVTGPAAMPLFRRLAAESAPPEWNFSKYLIDRRGRLAATFPPSTEPADPALTAAVERLLAEDAPPA